MRETSVFGYPSTQWGWVFDLVTTQEATVAHDATGHHDVWTHGLFDALFGVSQDEAMFDSGIVFGIAALCYGGDGT